MNKRTCTRCKQEQSLDSFTVKKRLASKDGYKSQCKECCKQVNAEYRANNLDKELLRSKNYYVKNKEKIDEQHKNYNETHKFENLERQRRYLKANPEKCKDYVNKRRARLVSNGVYLLLKKELKKIYSSPCFYCGSFDLIEADHVIPLSRGGTHSIGNLVPACQKCNRSKGSKYLAEWLLAIRL